jgi:DNA-binding MarR family transcriptional regulator
MNQPLPNPDFRKLADIDQIVHAPPRLMILTYLYVVESVDYVFLLRLTGLTWGNLSTHLTKLEDAGYIVVIKAYRGKKPHTTIRLSKTGRAALKQYKKSMKQILDDLKD